MLLGQAKAYNKQAKAVPHDRAGVAQGIAGEVRFPNGPGTLENVLIDYAPQMNAKHTVNKTVQITLNIDGSPKQRAKTLYVAEWRKNPDNGTIEYQLRETEADTGTVFRDGHWFPEKEVRNA